ncbi:hypothetical protein BU17DRAFT_37569 [Hysterangium stoloniferum]|nr:hypothetical protein BU17DRAFT_37569 [Hysterangium stoloniferum]
MFHCFALCTFLGANAYEYSPGWSPGQPKTRDIPPVATPVGFKPSEERRQSLFEGFSLTNILTKGPIGSLFTKAGINITDNLAEAKKKSILPWDERIPMITDGNYEELLFNENFATPEEEADRVWFIIVTVTSNQRAGISAFVDEQFNAAYNTTLEENDLHHVRWGRIDYLNVTRLTTKWGVWKAPMLIVAKDRGKTLRFFQPQSIGAKAPFMRQFLLDKTYERIQPWSGPWAPGGSQEYILDKFAIIQEQIYIYMSMIPRWMFLFITGGLGSLLLTLFHRKPAPKLAKTPRVMNKPAIEKPETDIVASPAASPNKTKKDGAQKRKVNRK